jgi:hypothetical protein
MFVGKALLEYIAVFATKACRGQTRKLTYLSGASVPEEKSLESLYRIIKCLEGRLYLITEECMMLSRLAEDKHISLHVSLELQCQRKSPWKAFID